MISARHMPLTETFAKGYPDHTFKFVTPENYQDFVCGRV